RDFHVTGVQTCALPIYLAYNEDGHIGALAVKAPSKKFRDAEAYLAHIQSPKAERVYITSEHLEVLFLRSNPSEDTGSRVWAQTRSEERRVGKECRDRWS